MVTFLNIRKLTLLSYYYSSFSSNSIRFSFVVFLFQMHFPEECVCDREKQTKQNKIIKKETKQRQIFPLYLCVCLCMISSV